MADWSDLTDTDTAEDRALTIELRGKEVPWLIDGKAIRVLKQRHDTDLSDVLAAAQSLALQAASVQAEALSDEEIDELSDEEREAIEESSGGDVMDLAEMYETVGLLLHAGAVRFEPSLKEEAVCGLVGPDNVGTLPLGTMIARAFPDEEEDDTAKKATTATS
jgi:hypothetical protein